MAKIMLDPGHGGTDSGAVGNGLYEKNLTLTIATKVKAYLENYYENAIVNMTRTGDTYPSLSARADMANSWGANLFVSIHINSGGGTGYEDFVYTEASTNSHNAQSALHAELAPLWTSRGFRDRGMKVANYAVLRETNMPAVLTENGFIDNVNDTALLKQSSFIEATVKAHAVGIAKYLGLKAKSIAADPVDDTPSGTVTMYRVIAGSFSVKDNADAQVAALKAKGFDAFVEAGTLYRVIAGSFSVKANADQRVADLKAAGFDAYVEAK